MVAMMGLGIGDEQGWRKGPWTPEEDKLLSEYVKLHGEGRWSSVSRCAGLKRNGKSCRLRWVNYLRPGLKRGHLTPQEEAIIIELHALWGNKWSTIARYLPGRTDNEIKNYWRTHYKKKEKLFQKQEERKSQNRLKQKKQNQQQQEQKQEEYGKKTEQENMNIEADRAKQEVVYMNNMKDEYFPVMSNEVTSWVDSVVEDFGLWGGQLWNFDGLSFHHDHTRNCTKIAMQNQTNLGGEPNNFYNGGYIF